MARLRYDAAADAYIGAQVVIAAPTFVEALKAQTVSGTPLVAALQALLEEAVWLAEGWSAASSTTDDGSG